MTNLYALDLQPYRSGRWRELLEQVPEARRRKALSCRFDADRARIAGAGWLLRHALEQAGLPASEQHFSETEHGKPYLADRTDLHFSLSHGGSWTVCAVGDQPLGVDVELPRCTMQIADRFFRPEELDYVKRLPPMLQRDALNRLWTGKESYLKALGVGLTMPLDSFYIELSPKTATLHQFQSDLPYRLHEYQPDLCRICLCTVDDEKPALQIVTPG